MIRVRCNVAGCASLGGIVPALRGGAMSVGGIVPALRGGAMSVASALQTCKAGAGRGAPQVGRSNTAVERT
jgi:hypothetical protein